MLTICPEETPRYFQSLFFREWVIPSFLPYFLFFSSTGTIKPELDVLPPFFSTGVFFFFFPTIHFLPPKDTFFVVMTAPPLSLHHDNIILAFLP